MKYQLKAYAIIAVASIVLFGCYKNNQVSYPGPPGINGLSGTQTGTINGKVTLTNSDGTQPTNKGNVTILLNNNKGDSVTVFTDTTGAWGATAVTGIYTITFSFAGYGTTTVNSYSFTGGGNTYINHTGLSQVPTFTTTISLDTMGGGSSPTKDFNINVTLSPQGSLTPNQEMNFFVYFGTDSTVSDIHYSGMVNIPVPAAQTSFKTSITGAQLSNAGIEGSEIVYVIAYPSAAAPAFSSKYIDEAKGKTIYTSLGTPSAVTSITVPF